jgi:hypothetical protein
MAEGPGWDSPVLGIGSAQAGSAVRPRDQRRSAGRARCRHSVFGLESAVLHRGGRCPASAPRATATSCRTALGRCLLRCVSVRSPSAHRPSRPSLSLLRGMLPGDMPTAPGFRVAIRYAPACYGLNAGEDWYDAFKMPDERMGATNALGCPSATFRVTTPRQQRSRGTPGSACVRSPPSREVGELLARTNGLRIRREEAPGAGL